jgi:uncharacterized protein YkwD
MWQASWVGYLPVHPFVPSEQENPDFLRTLYLRFVTVWCRVNTKRPSDDWTAEAHFRYPLATAPKPWHFTHFKKGRHVRGSAPRPLSAIAKGTVALTVLPLLLLSQTSSTELPSTELSSAQRSSTGTSTSGRFSFSDPERCFIKKINARRRAHGLRALETDPHLGYVARRHARQIGAERRLRHDDNYGQEITGWRRLGQNTGRGEGCDGLFAAFWRSDKHRHNILARWRFIGVGVDRAGGRMYVQQVFEWKGNPGNIYGTP